MGQDAISNDQMGSGIMQTARSALNRAESISLDSWCWINRTEWITEWMAL